MQHNGWDQALKVTADGAGLIGHAGAVLLRKAADQVGLTGQLSGALQKKGTSPAFDRGAVLVSLAAAIAAGATSMSGIALLAHLAPVLADAPSGPTERRALDLAGTPAMLDRIARARAKARTHVWDLAAKIPAGVPGSHPQYIGSVHRGHAVVETSGVRTAKAMALRNLPSKTLAGQQRLRFSPVGSGSAPCPHPPDQHGPSHQHERRTPRHRRSRYAPGHPGNPTRSPPQGQTDIRPKTDTSTISNRTSNRLND